MNRDDSTRETGSANPTVDPFLRAAARTSHREPGGATRLEARAVSDRAAGRRTLLRRLVPAAGATYHAGKMPKTVCERVGLIGDRSELIVRFLERRAEPHPDRPVTANVPSCDVLSRS